MSSLRCRLRKSPIAAARAFEPEETERMGYEVQLLLEEELVQTASFTVE